MPTSPEDLSRTINTREGMAVFLDALAVDAIERGSEWQNIEISAMLESMGAWLRDSADTTHGRDPDLGAAHWQFCAKLLLAGKHYE